MKKIPFNDYQLDYLEFSFSEQEKLYAIRAAIEKSQHTMNYNQNTKKRTAYQKIEKQLQGILAEMAVEKLLKRILKDNSDKIIRYDDVRTDNFRSAKNEFDIKIETKKRDYFFEIRSSIFHHHINYENLKKYPIIGPYYNEYKQNEKMADFFFRPLFKVKKHNGQNSLLKSLEDDQLKLFIANGCSKKYLKNNFYIGNLGQNNTKYNLVPISDNNNIINFSLDLQKFFNNIFYNEENNNKKIRKNKNKP